MARDAYLPDTLREFRKQKDLTDRALAQVSDERFFATLDPDSNSIAIIVKHMAGNMRSRWTDFLTTDGEKPDRNRDSEFVIEPSDTRAALMDRWEAGWRTLFAALEPLSPRDLERTVTVRGKPYSVVQAILWQVSHYGYHVGQIVLLAKHFAAAGWQTLTIPKAKPASTTGRGGA